MQPRPPRQGRLVVLSGPSGVGKDTVLNAWIARNPLVVRVVTYTTRDRRETERDGVDYHFVTKERFDELHAAGHFLEAKPYGGAWYASPKTDTDLLLAQGKVAVLKIEVKGAKEVRKLRPDALLIFILPPSVRELKRRLIERYTESPEKQAERLQIAIDELACADDYDVRIVNEVNGVEQCVDALEEAIR